MDTIALVMKWYDNSSYEMGMLALLMNWVRWLICYEMGKNASCYEMVR